MKSVTIPLAGSYNQRGINGTTSLAVPEDQRFLNCTFRMVKNAITGNNTVYVEKRPGWVQDSIVAANNSSTGVFKTLAINGVISAFGSTNSTIYFATQSVGTITGLAFYFTETKISGVTHVMIKSSDGTGWFYAADSNDTLTYTADGNNSTTITDIKVGGANSVSGLYVGQKLTAASNIAAGSRIVSIDSAAFSAVLDTATTGGAFNDLSITKEPIAKIIDADFVTTGSYISAFAEMDGYLLYSTSTTAGLRNSDINSAISYPASGTLDPNLSPDEPRAIARQRNAIILFGGSSKEVFTNAGNAFGSPLQRQPAAFERIGAVNQLAITTIENDIFFVSSSSEGDVGVYKMSEYQAERVSTPQIDTIIGTVSATNGTIYANSFRLGGYKYVGFVLSSASEFNNEILLENQEIMLLESGDNTLMESNPATTAAFVRFLVYNADLNIWGEWDTTKATFIDAVNQGSNNQIFATSRMETDGKVYAINPALNGEVFTDDGDAYSMEIRTSKTDFGTEARKFISKVSLMGCDIQTTSTATLEYSDDDYGTWTTAGTFDLTRVNPYITQLGSFQSGRAWRLTHSAAVPFRAQSLKFDFDVGTH